MGIFKPASSAQLALATAILRVVTGVVFAAHGAQKLFVYGFDGVAGAFTQMGIPAAGIAGPTVALLEFIGGLALVLGLLTRPFAMGLAAVMAGAIVFAHFAAGFFMPNGYEFVLTLFAASLAFALIGGGRFSLDTIIANRTQRRR